MALKTWYPPKGRKRKVGGGAEIGFNVPSGRYDGQFAREAHLHGDNQRFHADFGAAQDFRDNRFNGHSSQHMDFLNDFLQWAWARHHNPLSWYIRPLFVLPLCYFAYKRRWLGIILTVLAVLSSMFWFPAPDSPGATATAFLEVERQYITGDWTISKIAMTALVPAWFAVLTWACWSRSWLGAFLVVNLGALLKVIWSFYFGGSTAWSIIPPVLLGSVIINGVGFYWYWRIAHQREAGFRDTKDRVD